MDAHDQVIYAETYQYSAKPQMTLMGSQINMQATDNNKNSTNAVLTTGMNWHEKHNKHFKNNNLNGMKVK